jgi:menaquinone-dependent protoporphyrinogen IX oxidase
MNLALVYVSKYGATAEIARRLAESFDGRSTLHDLKRERHPDVTAADIILVGGGVHAGEVHPRLERFLESTKDTLLAKHTGIFLSCLARGEAARAYLESAFPAWLLAHAFVKSTPGGYARFSDMGPIDRFLMKRFAGQESDIEALDEAEIALLIEAVKALSS